MHIVCEHCGAGYELDLPTSALSQPGRKLKFRCSACGRSFAVRHGEAEELSTEEASAPPPKAARGMLLKQAGRIYHVSDAATLQRWIVERRVDRTDLLATGEGKWEPVGTQPELAPFFQVVALAEVSAATPDNGSAGPRPATGAPTGPRPATGAPRGRPAGDLVLAEQPPEPGDEFEIELPDLPEATEEREVTVRSVAQRTLVPETAAGAYGASYTWSPDEGSASLGGVPNLALPSEVDAEDPTVKIGTVAAARSASTVPVPPPSLRPDPPRPTGAGSLSPSEDLFFGSGPAPVAPRASGRDHEHVLQVQEDSEEYPDGWQAGRRRSSPLWFVALIMVVVVALVGWLWRDRWATLMPSVQIVMPGEQAEAADAQVPAQAAVTPAVVSEPAPTVEQPAAAPSTETPPAEVAPAPAAALKEPEAAPKEPEADPEAEAPRPVAVSSRSLSHRGWAALDRGNLILAREYFTQAVDKETTNASARFGLGYVAEKEGRVEAAVQSYCAAQRYAGRDAETAAEVAGRLRILGRTCY